MSRTDIFISILHTNKTYAVNKCSFTFNHFYSMPYYFVNSCTIKINKKLTCEETHRVAPERSPPAFFPADESCRIITASAAEPFYKDNINI